MKCARFHNNLIAIEDAHSRRPRHAYFGEQEQADATPYEWVSGKIWHLHLAIDDATGIVTGGVGLTRRKRFMPIIMYSNRF